MFYRTISDFTFKTKQFIRRLKFFARHKSFLCLIISILYSLNFYGQQQEVLQELLTAIENTSEYDALKRDRIKDLKSQLEKTPDSALMQRYYLNQELYNEYRIFKQDSAFKYGLETRRLAEQLENQTLMADAVISLANVCVSAGMFREALEFLEPVNPEEIPDYTRSSYYGLLGRCYTDMAEYSNLSFFTATYNDSASIYHQRALSLIEPETYTYTILEGYIKYKEGALNEALENMLMLYQQDWDIREEAVINSILGDIYAQKGEQEKAIFHLSKASIADIMSSAKENLAMIRLAEILFKEGDVQTASVFIKKANEDAAFYGAQQRKIRVGAILPLIEEQIIEQIEKQRARLYRQNIMLSVLLLFVIVLAVVIYSQVGRLKKARKTISEAHEKLQVKNRQVIAVNEEIGLKNEELNRVNNQLLEANKIKEEYIGFFFTQDADIFEKFREFKTKIEMNLKKENVDGIKYLVGNYDLKREKEKLLQNFDEAFIKLFPNFIEEFNSLLKDEEQIKVKKGKILNKELRIFALMRLGITHNEIIAQILGYSVNSIYAYKTKIRKKSWLDKKDFDQKLFENTRLRL